MWGVEQYVYSDTVTLPAFCADWTFSFELCCRNAAITNLSNPGSQSIYFQTMLDNLNTPFNNAPVFNELPTFFIYNNQSYQMNFSAFDVDGDSLIYYLATPLTSNGSPISYAVPYNATNPMSASTPITFDPATGIFGVTPNAQQVAVISVIIDEYRNNQLIGRVTRDVQIVVVNGNNILPATNGVDSTGNFVATVCAGDTLDFNIPTSDPDSGQSVTLTLLDTIPGATFDTTGGADPVGHFTWITDTSLVSAQPYLFKVKLQDDACPIFGTTHYLFKIYVTNCQAAEVWPGDANYDYIADMRDILPIGIGYGATGPVRANASTNWTGQLATDWTQSLLSGVNYKHADCNGDGVIDSIDLGAIALNYGFMHNKTGALQTPTGVPFRIDISQDTIYSGNMLHADIYLGDSAIAIADSVYGVAMSLRYDASLVKTDSFLQVDFNNSWIGTEQLDMLTLVKRFDTTGKLDIGMVRLDQQNQSGAGKLASLSMVMQDDITGKRSIFENFAFQVDMLKIISFDETDVSTHIITDTVVIYQQQTTAAGHIQANNGIALYPNPAAGLVLIASPGVPFHGFTVYNALGRAIRSVECADGERFLLEVQQFPDGMYFIRTHDRANRATGWHKLLKI